MARFNNVSRGDVNRVPGCQGLAITLRVRTLRYTIQLPRARREDRLAMTLRLQLAALLAASASAFQLRPCAASTASVRPALASPARILLAEDGKDTPAVVDDSLIQFATLSEDYQTVLFSRHAPCSVPARTTTYLSLVRWCSQLWSRETRSVSCRECQVAACVRSS